MAPFVRNRQNTRRGVYCAWLYIPGNRKKRGQQRENKKARVNFKCQVVWHSKWVVVRTKLVGQEENGKVRAEYEGGPICNWELAVLAIPVRQSIASCSPVVSSVQGAVLNQNTSTRSHSPAAVISIISSFAVFFYSTDSPGSHPHLSYFIILLQHSNIQLISCFFVSENRL
jgi:hypothetical protein